MRHGAIIIVLSALFIAITDAASCNFLVWRSWSNVLSDLQQEKCILSCNLNDVCGIGLFVSGIASPLEPYRFLYGYTSVNFKSLLSNHPVFSLADWDHDFPIARSALALSLTWEHLLPLKVHADQRWTLYKDQFRHYRRTSAAMFPLFHGGRLLTRRLGWAWAWCIVYHPSFNIGIEIPALHVITKFPLIQSRGK